MMTQILPEMLIINGRILCLILAIQEPTQDVERNKENGPGNNINEAETNTAGDEAIRRDSNVAQSDEVIAETHHTSSTFDDDEDDEDDRLDFGVDLSLDLT